MLSKVLGLDYLSCPQIWNIEKEKDRGSRRQASEAQREKGRQRSRARDKKKRRHFLLEEQHENFVAVVIKMRNARGNEGENERAVIKKVSKNKYDISSKKSVTKKFPEVSCCSRAKQRQRNVPKKCAARAKLLFLLIRPIVVFSPSSLPSPLSITRFYILFEQTINII